MTLPSLRNQKGFTLIEVLMVVLLITILAVVSIAVLPDTINESRFNQTVAKLNEIRNSMIGNPDIREGTTRTSFGYLGDVGSLPPGPTIVEAVAALLARGAIPAFAVNSSVRFGFGWNGPYLTGVNTSTNFTKDAWGNLIVYSPAASPPTLISRGADGAVGGTGFDQDITVTLPTELTTATVSGFICQGGGPFTGSADVELNYPDGSGALTAHPTSLKNLVPADKGNFSFGSIPFGVRSISIYIPSGSPTITLGPVLITVDKPNLVVPCDRIDISP